MPCLCVYIPREGVARGRVCVHPGHEPPDLGLAPPPYRSRASGMLTLHRTKQSLTANYLRSHFHPEVIDNVTTWASLGKARPKGRKALSHILSTIQEALPQAAKVRVHPVLVAEECMVPTRMPEDMGPYTGICLAYKDEVADVLRRVGHTLHPVAMLTRESAGALGMR
eukprot:1652350-Amphidinium_carterae.1